MILINVSTIVDYNEALTGVEVNSSRITQVGSIFSSIEYYASIQEKISCIVCLLVKNHYFIDGNKRTALAVYLTLCRLNNIPISLSTDELVNAMVKIAVSQYNVELATKLLFKDLS